MSPEMSPGHEFANKDELLAAHKRIKEWVLQHGTFVSSEARVATDIDSGLTIYFTGHNEPDAAGVKYEYEVSDEALRLSDESARAALSMSNDVTITYTPAHYEYNCDERQLIFYPERSALLYETDDSSVYNHALCQIGLQEEGGDIVPRGDVYKIGISDVFHTVTEDMSSSRVKDFCDTIALEEALGTNRMTSDDCEAVTRFIQTLKELK